MRAWACRGHRKADPFSAEAYLLVLPVADGRAVALTCLAALVRLADEMDIAADRNLSFLCGMDRIEGVAAARGSFLCAATGSPFILTPGVNLTAFFYPGVALPPYRGS